MGAVKQHRITVPDGERWRIFCGIIYPAVSATTSVTLFNKLGNYIAVLESTGAGTAYNYFPAEMKNS